jgi:Tfp pilus assembly protein PilN
MSDRNLFLTVIFIALFLTGVELQFQVEELRQENRLLETELEVYRQAYDLCFAGQLEQIDLELEDIQELTNDIRLLQDRATRSLDQPERSPLRDQ